MSWPYFELTFETGFGIWGRISAEYMFQPPLALANLDLPRLGIIFIVSGWAAKEL